MDPRRLLAPPWPLRAAWLGLPLVAGPALADALADVSRPVQVVASLGSWAGWAAGLVASLVPRSVTLTAVRLLAPAAAAISLAAARPPVDATEVAGVAWSLLTVVTALTASTADVFVDGSSYGDERRFALRTPAPLLAGPVALTWALAGAGLVAGPLLLAARQWVPGALALAAGVPVSVLAVRSLHGLSRRWIVLVPAGLVVHDPLALADPVLFRRSEIESLGPARADSDALDLSGRAPGLALEMRIAEPRDLPVVRGRRAVETVAATAILVTPGRPGSLLREAEARRIRAG